MLRLTGALLILATLAGGILYFQSDFFRFKADQTVKDWTEWTPENITKDPKGYLQFAVGELDKIKGQLEAHKLHLNVELDKTVTHIKGQQLTTAASTNVLDELRTVYHNARKVYPVSFQGKNLDETAFQEKVVEVARAQEYALDNVTRLEKHQAHLEAELKRAEQELRNLADKRQFVQQRLQHLTLDLAVNNSDELTSKADEIAAIARAIRSEGSKAKQDASALIQAEKTKLQGQSLKEYFEKTMESK